MRKSTVPSELSLAAEMDMLHLLGSTDRSERATAINWWAHRDGDRAIATLLPLAFRGDDELDSGIIQVMTRIGSSAVDSLLDIAFDSLATCSYDAKILQHNINALAKYTAGAPTALHKYLRILDREPPHRVLFNLLERYLQNLSKQPKQVLGKLETGLLADVIKRYRSDPTTWGPGQVAPVRGQVSQVLERCGDTSVFLGDRSTEILLRQILSGDGAFNETMGNKWRSKFRDLAKEYCEIATVPQATTWYKNYTVSLFRLLEQHPDAMNPRWLDTAVKISRPNGEETETLAWRVIQQAALVESGGYCFRGDHAVSSVLFEHLMSEGNISAMQEYHRLLARGVAPSTGTCNGYLRFLEYLAGPEFWNRLSLLVMDIGNMWELLCREAAGVLYGDVLVHPTLPNGRVPDLIPTNGAVWAGSQLVRAGLIIECKKSNSSIGLHESPSEKYGDFGDELEVWILEPTPRTKPPSDFEGARVVCAEDIIHRVESLDQAVADSMADFLGRYRSPYFEATLFAQCAREKGVPAQTIEEAVTVFEIIFPHFKSLGIQRWLDPSWGPPLLGGLTDA